MSSLINTNLLEEAAFYIDYFEGTVIGKVLQADLSTNDLEGLNYHIQDARDTAFALEFNPGGVA